MAIAKSPLFDAISKSTKRLTFRFRKNKKIEISKKRIPANPRTQAQKEQRNKYNSCVEQYKKLSEAEKEKYRQLGYRYNLSAYHMFMKECLKKALFNYEITIDNTANSNDLTDYQILLEIVNDATFFEDCENNQAYLEFYDEDKTTILSHYIEEFDTVNKNAKIWIKIPQIQASAIKTIYLKINKSRTEDLSDPEAVFDVWDDFEDGIYDTAKWNDNGVGTISEESGELIISNTTTAKTIIWSNRYASNERIVVETEAKGSNSRMGLTLVNQTGDYVVWHWLWRGDQNEIGVYKFSDNMVTNLESYYKAFTTQEGVYHYFKTIFDGVNGKVIGYVRNLNNLSESTVEFSPSYAVEGYIGLACYNTNANYRYIRARKYAEPEPIIAYTRL